MIAFEIELECPVRYHFRLAAAHDHLFFFLVLQIKNPITGEIDDPLDTVPEGYQWCG